MKIRNLRHLNLSMALVAIVGISSLFTSCSRQMSSIQNSGKLQYQQALNHTNPATDAQKLSQTKLVALPDIATPALTCENTPVNNQTATASAKPAAKAAVTTKTNHFLAKSKIIKQDIFKTIDKQVASASTTFKNNNILGHKHFEHASSFHRAFYFIILGLIFCLIGAFLPWIIGGLFELIGAIFIIFGLLYLIFDLARMA